MSRITRVVKLAVIAGLIGLLSCKGETPAPRPPQPTPTPQPSPSQLTIAALEESALIERSSPFKHNTKAHKQECAVCHQRLNNDPTPSFPGHSSCIDCHQKDFTNPASQMCAVCHQTPLEAEPKLISFPQRLSQFGVRAFPHKTHLEAQKMPPDRHPIKCDACHRFYGGGVEASFPRHPECYSCHSHQAGEKLGECSTCHVGATAAVKYRPGVGAAFNLYNFKHSSHLKSASCERCHRLTDVPAQAARPDILQISTARGQRHKSACWSCHVQSREPVCTKCHKGALPF